MFRSIEKIAALLYLDNNYEISRDDIVNKYIEGIFVTHDNKYMEVGVISSNIEDEFKVIISESEIINAIERFYLEYKVLKTHDNEGSYQLKDMYYKDLCDKTCENLIEKYISDFVGKMENNDNEENTREIIWKFLYELFGKKIDGFSHLIGKEIDFTKFGIESLDLNDHEKRIINQFLNYDNPDKDRAIFNIACYALEYCLFVSNIDSKTILDEKLTKKTFYLDTNILFRALGINGERRERRTKTFLNKCLKAGQNLKITNCTLIEFSKSMEHHCNALHNHHGKRVNGDIYKDLFEDGDVEGAYYDWSNGRINAKPEIFQAAINAKLKQLINEFNISLDQYDYSIEKKFQENYEQLKKGMSKLIDKDPKNITHDAYDLQVVTKLRENFDKDILETEFFYISTDYTLKVWDDQNSGYLITPRIFYPDQWLTLLIRFSERSKDDIKSFISFVNLSINHPLMDTRKFNRIVAGIVEITEDYKLQKEIVESMIASSFSMFKNTKVESLTAASSNFTHNFVDEKIRSTRSENDELHTTVIDLNGKVTSLEQEFTKQKDETLKEKIEKVKVEKELKDFKRIKKIEEYKKRGRVWILILIIQCGIIATTFDLFGSQFNLYKLSVQWASEDTWRSAVITIVAALVFGGIIKSLKKIYNYYWCKEKQSAYANTMIETE